MKITITSAHLDAATAKPWSTDSCLFQQALEGKLYNKRGDFTFILPPEANSLMRKFDCCNNVEASWNQQELDEIRASLPVTFDLTPLHD